jgi:hypothetical protein
VFRIPLIPGAMRRNGSTIMNTDWAELTTDELDRASGGLTIVEVIGAAVIAGAIGEVVAHSGSIAAGIKTGAGVSQSP